MREILFRGKRVDNGEWIEGFYCKDEYLKDRIWVLDEDNFLAWWEVDPATVGQFTGLLDKNGKRVFEGDIANLDLHTAKYVCAYRSDHGAFMWNCLVTNENRFLGHYGEKVIGNIHDCSQKMNEGEK